MRGNTQRALVRMLREAGALEVHVRIASPPVRWPCFYGIDFATRAELIASGSLDDRGRPPRHRRRLASATSRIEGMIAATEQPRSRLCSACFDGEYPIELPGETALGKNVIEPSPIATSSGAASGDPGPLSVGSGAADALRRP